MNITEIKTSKFDGFGVLVPEDANCWVKGIILTIERQNDNLDTYDLLLDKGQYKIIGIQTEITEEQAKEVVEELAGVYRNYKKRVILRNFSLYTALESFNSLMQKLEMFSENPYGEKPYYDLDTAFYLEPRLEQWQQAQQRTGKWLFIQKIK